MRTKTQEDDFKIIGLRVGANCAEHLSKVLVRGNPYYFYPAYKLNPADDFEDFPKEKNNLFGPGINISAIVGQNGTGKSTLVELLFMAINNVGRKLEIKDDLVQVKGLEVSVFFKDIEHYRLNVKGLSISLQQYDTNGKLKSAELFEEKKKFLNQFFYTIVINYSHYAYNSRDIKADGQKDWLTPLFHKNDSYQTPIVINPYRKEGDIKINTENDLVRQRLLANLLSKDSDHQVNFRLLTDHLHATHLGLKLGFSDPDKVLFEEKIIDQDGKEQTKEWRLAVIDPDYNAILKKLNETIKIDYQENELESSTDAIREAALGYLVQKLITMSLKYQDYYGYFLKDTSELDLGQLSTYVGLLMDDPSHIAYKFRQTINFLRFRQYSNNDVAKALSIEILAESLDKLKTDKIRVIDLLPPPIFQTDILLSPDEKAEKPNFQFNKLSSGEKQLIYSVSSILYHLANLNSVVSWDRKPKQKYHIINIVFEEIELYFHPELQRRYIKYLLDRIGSIALDTISGINLIFVTHSPFILSDIPSQNILFLKMEDEQAVQVYHDKKTFGANIHNLLSDGFFMRAGLCGAFAQDKINKIIIGLNLKKELNELEKKKGDTKYKMPQNEKERLKDLLKKVIKIDFSTFPEIIDVIGEGIIRNKLRQMYDEAFGLDQSEWIKKEIKRLEALLPKHAHVPN
ncbi:AAA family ATPase [Mucilaginibacter sp. AW1-3]